MGGVPVHRAVDNAWKAFSNLVITSTNPNSTGQRKRLEDGRSSCDAKGVCRTKLIPTQVVYVQSRGFGDSTEVESVIFPLSNDESF